MLPGESAFLGTAGGANRRHAHGVHPLAGEQSDAACRCMKQHFLAGLESEAVVQQVACREALQHHRGGHFEGNAVRQLHHMRGRDVARGGVGVVRQRIGDTVARLQARNACAHRADHPRGFGARNQQLWVRPGIEARAVVAVDEVHADGTVFDLNFAGARRKQGQVNAFENIAAASCTGRNRIGIARHHRTPKTDFND